MRPDSSCPCCCCASALTIATELQAACAAGYATRAGVLAHKLKSSARSVGALARGEICAEMEAAGKAGETAMLKNYSKVCG